MALTEKCPACGAPVEVSEVEGSTFRCGFCSTELRLEDVDGELHLMVAGKPSPQSEVLSDKAQEVLSEQENDFARVFGDVESGGPVVVTDDRTRDESERDIYVASFQGEAMPEPPSVGDEDQVAPGYATRASSMADVNDWIPENRSAEPDNPVIIPESPPYQASPAPAAAVPGRSNTGRWIAIGLALFVGVCIMCACVVGAFMAITNNVNF